MIQGSIVALITPFNEDGSVNFKKLRELIDWHVDEKTDAILVLGTTAETPTLTLEEELPEFERYAKAGFTEIDYVLNQRAVDEATSWLKRIIVTWLVLNTLGFAVAYLQPLIQGGMYNG